MSARRRSTSHLGPLAWLGVDRSKAFVRLAGLCVICIVPALALAQTPTAVTPSARDDQAHIAEAAKLFRLPPAWIRAVLGAESAGDRHAISRKGAMGLMQIMPTTWFELRARYRLGSDPYDPHDNIIAGSAYIRELLDRFGSPGWIAAYNAGPARYEASLRGRRLPRETRAYVTAVASAISSGGGSPSLPSSPGWRKAPLFAAQPVGKPAAEPGPVEPSRDDAPSVRAGREPSNVKPQSSGLFVTKASNETDP